MPCVLVTFLKKVPKFAEILRKTDLKPRWRTVQDGGCQRLGVSCYIRSHGLCVMFHFGYWFLKNFGRLQKGQVACRIFAHFWLGPKPKSICDLTQISLIALIRHVLQKWSLNLLFVDHIFHKLKQHKHKLSLWVAWQKAILIIINSLINFILHSC